MLADLALTFSEAVRAGLGTIELHSSDGALIETFDVSSSSRIHISGNVVTIDPTLPLGSGSGYYLTVSAGAFTDASGNDFAGIIDASTIKFTTSGISAPTVRQNEHGGQNIVVTDPSQITADLGTDSVDHLFYSGSGTITLPSSIENLSLTGGSTKVEANGLDNTLRASVGNDTVNGGAGRDTISGGAGHDQLSGSSGNDRISGGTGSDVVDGGSGNDRIFGDTGNDTIWGGVGSDRVSGGSGRDSIYGGMGNDQLSGGAGDDRLFGGSGNDSVHGGSGNDRVYGDSGHDTVHGSFGNDTIYGGTGNDVLSGGSRRDSFVFDTKLNAGSNVDTIRDFTSGEDSVWLDRAIFAELGVGYEEGRMSLGASSFVYGTSAQGAQDRIIYDWFTGSLYYDCDGTGLAAQVKFATVSNNALLTYRDFFVV
jgi:Ca2+-binding RTX toxin-like protein